MRPRKRGNKDLPANLYSYKKGSTTYYKYRNPVSAKVSAFGTHKVEAVQAARQLNQLLVKQSSLIDSVVKPDHPFKDYLTYYVEDLMPKRMVKGKALSKRTIKEDTRIIKSISRELGHIDMTQITQRDVAEYLNAQSTAGVHNKHRSVLKTVFRYAISDGRVKENFAANIVKRDESGTKRARLTLEQYKAIYLCAKPHIQNAMELSLNIIQRREDIRTIRFDQIKDDEYLYTITSKTEKYGKAAYIRIPTNLTLVHSEKGAKSLAELIRMCRDHNVCPYVIHKRPKRHGVKMSEEKDHVMQLTCDEISKGFANARNMAGIKVDAGMTPPTFHELISLGEHLRHQQGWSIKHIQTLRGHTSEKMTLDYLDGHGDNWTTVVTPQNI